MKNFLSIFALFAFVLSACAEIHVDVSPGNGIIHVWGDVEISDYIPITNVCANYMGTCTNCVNISPSEMRAYKTTILSECDAVSSNLIGISHSAIQIYSRMVEMEQDISSFRKFDNSPVSWSSSSNAPFTNYVYSVDNTQTALDRGVRPPGVLNNAAVNRWASYNNGIYAYANDYVLPQLSTTRQDAEEIVAMVDDAQLHIDTIKTVVGSMSEDACDRCSGGDGGGGCDGGSCDGGVAGGSCTNCPCAEQLDAINSYVQHIDDDFHDQLLQMSIVTNFIPRMDAYARLVSGVLYNNATIVVDDGENSWSNVYRRGHSDLYDYDKSNILQRIELLLYGLTPMNSATNWGDIADIESGSVNVQEQINGVSSTISEGHDGLAENVTTIRGKISTLFNTLNFFGSSNMSTFTLNDPFRVFGVYEVEGIEPSGIDGLESFRGLIRSCFQVFYWVSGIAFMIAFWYFVVSFVVHCTFGFLKFFNNLLT